jgi:predicted PurR-regulated permease PerM
VTRRRDITLAAGGTAVVLLVAGAFVAGYRLQDAILLLFSSLVLAVTLEPIADWFSRRGLPRSAVSLVLHVAILGLIAAFVFFVVPVAAAQLSAFKDKWPELLAAVRERLSASSNVLLRHFATLIPTASAAGPAVGGVAKLVSGALAVAERVSMGVVSMVLILVVSHAWVVEDDAVIRAATLHLSIERRERTREIYRTVRGKLGAYVRSQLVVCASSATMATVAYLLIGLPYALVLGLCTGIGELVPVFGMFIGSGLALLIALSISSVKALWVVAFVAANHVLQSYLLMPRLAGRAVGVSALVVLLSLSAFGALLGVPGAVLAIPLAALLQILVDRLVLHPEPRQLGGRDRQSLLRLRARELAADARRVVREDRSRGGQRYSHEAEAIAADLDRILATTDDEAA